MTMTIHEQSTVGEVAAAVAQAMPVFEKLGIDYCCGGKKLFEQALAEKSISKEQFLVLLKEEQNKRADTSRADFTAMSPATLSAYIEDTHHTYLREKLPEIETLLLAVVRAHGKNHGELFDVYKLFGSLKADLEQHLIREEQLLFPALEQEGAEQRARALTAIIIGEHEVAGAVLEKLRNLTKDYTPPEDACLTYQRVYTLLPELEGDLHRHIHLENNVLLKDLDYR